VVLPDPENIQLNRFYTEEFFAEVKHILNPEGVLCFTLSGAENYLPRATLALNGSVYSALHHHFTYIEIFPGLTHYYLASDHRK